DHVQQGRIRGRGRRHAGHGRHRLQPGASGGVLLPPDARMDDRRRIDGNPQEPDRRDHLRPAVLAAGLGFTGDRIKDMTTSTGLREALLAPGRIAIVGASDDLTKTASRPLNYLRRGGYSGTVYPVNSKR